jgi:hypothetical protein
MAPLAVRITIHADSKGQLREILRGEDLDLECGGPKKLPDGTWAIEAYAPSTVATRLRKRGIRVDVDKELDARSMARRAEVGAGDRFKGGRVAPRGLGRKE